MLGHFWDSIRREIGKTCLWLRKEDSNDSSTFQCKFPFEGDVDGFFISEHVTLSSCMQYMVLIPPLEFRQMLFWTNTEIYWEGAILKNKSLCLNWMWFFFPLLLVIEVIITQRDTHSYFTQYRRTWAPHALKKLANKQFLHQIGVVQRGNSEKLRWH